MAKFQLNPGEIVVKEANAPCMGKSLGIVPGAFPGRGILTNQRFVHFKRNPGIGGGGVAIVADLMGEKIDFEFPLATIQSLQRFDKFNLPSLVIKTTDGQQYKLINNPAYGKLDVDMWIEAFREALTSYANKQMTAGADNLWTAQA